MVRRMRRFACRLSARFTRVIDFMRRGVSERCVMFSRTHMLPDAAMAPHADATPSLRGEGVTLPRTFFHEPRDVVAIFCYFLFYLTSLRHFAH